QIASLLHAGISPGCRPGRCGRSRRQMRMKAAITAEASGRLNAKPPWLTGLSRKSPTVAPSGRVRMKEAQDNVTRETFVHEYNVARNAKPALKTRAPPSYPRPPVSAIQSPSAVPRVWEKVIAPQ